MVNYCPISSSSPRLKAKPTAMLRCSVHLAVIAAVCVAHLAAAHHSNAGFDMERVVAFDGTVLSFEWTNPHVYLTVRDSAGVVWLVESDATPVMVRSGWSRESFAPGDDVSVRLNPDRRAGRAHGLLLSVEGPEGLMSSLNRTGLTAAASAAARAESLFGVWRGEVTAARTYIATMARHPVTQQGQTAKDAYDQSSNPTVACITWPTPWLMAGYLYLHELRRDGDVIRYRNEFYGAERVIYMDGRDHPENVERTLQGHSIGWWEADTLVVDTVAFADHRSPYAATVGVPAGPRKHVVERFRLSADGTQAIIDFVIEDPDYFSEPASAQAIWSYAPHFEMLELPCDAAVSTRYQ